MAQKRITELEETTTVKGDHYIPVDHGTEGTKKLSMDTLMDETLTVQGKAAEAKAAGDAIRAEVATRESEIAVERARITNLATLTDGSTTGDAELMDIRVGADGTTYTNAGTAVRSQVSALKDDLTKSFTINSVQNGSMIDFNDVNIKPGDVFFIDVDIVSGSATDIVLYANSTSGTVLGYLYINNRLYITAEENISKVRGYIRGNNSAVLSGSLTVMSGIQTFNYNVDDRVDSIDTDKTTDLVQDGIWLNWYVNIKEGDSFYIDAALESGESTDALLYANTTSGTTPFAILNYGRRLYVTAEEDITKVIGFPRGNNSAVLSGSLTVMSDIQLVHDINDRLSAVENGHLIIPGYAETMLDTIANTLGTLQNSESTTIAFITDLHVNGSTQSDNTQYVIATSINALNAISKKQPIDFSVLNGDYIFNPTSQTRSETLAWYKGLASSVERLNIPVFIGKGNHDVNDIALTTDEYLTDEELYQAFLKYSTLAYNGNYGHLEKAYGYYDIPNKKTRFIFVNTLDTPFVIENNRIKYDQQHTTGVSNEQVNFIANALKFVESGWGVVFFSHQALQESNIITPGSSTANFLDPDHGGEQLLGVISAYKNKSSYISSVETGDFQYNIDVDFTNNPSNEIIAMVCGHTHSDRTDVVDGIRMISTMASSFRYDSYDNSGNVVERTIGTNSETSWDVFTFDRKNRKIYATRYGYGEDREFEY